MSAFLIGVVSVLLSYGIYIFSGQGSIWGITTGESKIGGWVWRQLGAQIEQLKYFQQFKLTPLLEDPTQLVVIAILIGGLSAALLSRSYAFKHLPGKYMLVQAVIGGFLLGYGARLALGCNIGNFFSAWAAGGTHAVIFTATLLAGSFIGFKITERIFLRGAKPFKFNYAPRQNTQLLTGILVLALSLIFTTTLKPISAIWWLAGIAFGALGWISTICFATCYRDIIAPKYASGIMVRAVGIAILTYGFGIFILQLLGIPFKFGTPPIGQLQVALGGVIFGLGIGISGTCIFSSEWRAGGGSIYSMIVFASTILLGMPTLAFHYDWWLTILPQDPRPITLYSYGPIYGFIAPLIFSLTLISYGIYVDTSMRNTISSIITNKIPIRILRRG